MIIGAPEHIPPERGDAYHGGAGPYMRRTLLEAVPGSVLKYVRDITIPAGTSIGRHLHTDDEELYFVVSGEGVMAVDAEECPVGPGTAVLALPGSTHAIRNEGTEELRIVVVCAGQAEGAHPWSGRPE
jgi:uncharacterized cupin superfamily protein